jgi:hypothetical protein
MSRMYIRLPRILHLSQFLRRSVTLLLPCWPLSCCHIFFAMLPHFAQPTCGYALHLPRLRRHLNPRQLLKFAAKCSQNTAFFRQDAISHFLAHVVEFPGLLRDLKRRQGRRRPGSEVMACPLGGISGSRVHAEISEILGHCKAKFSVPKRVSWHRSAFERS